MTFPQANQLTTRRRLLLDRGLKAVDVTVGAVALVIGVAALIYPPPTIIREVTLPQLITFWGVALIVGGLGSGIGRLTGIWIVETCGIVALGTGAAIYLAVVSTSIVRELGVAVAVGLILIACLGMLKRYLELQAFVSEPGDVPLLDRIRHLWRIRTNAPQQ